MKKLIKKIKGRFATELPRTSADLVKFCDEIFKTYDLPDLPTYRRAIGSRIMMVPETTNKLPKRVFAIAIKNAMSKQLSFDMIQFINSEEKKKEQEAKKASEATEKPIDGASLNEPKVLHSCL